MVKVSEGSRHANSVAHSCPSFLQGPRRFLRLHAYETLMHLILRTHSQYAPFVTVDGWMLPLLFAASSSTDLLFSFIFLPLLRFGTVPGEYHSYVLLYSILTIFFHCSLCFSYTMKISRQLSVMASSRSHKETGLLTLLFSCFDLGFLRGLRSVVLSGDLGFLRTTVLNHWERFVEGVGGCSQGETKKRSFSPNLALARPLFPSHAKLSLISLPHPPLTHLLYMAPQGKKCPGCLKSFTSRRAHLAQASSPLCRKLAKMRRISCLGFIRAPQRSPPQQPDSRPLFTPHGSSPIPTNGTPSLTQDDDQLPDQDLPHTPSTENESDDEDDDFSDVSESESLPGWEPPILDNTDNMSVSSDHTDPDTPPSPVPPEDLRERTWVMPKVIRYPDPQAGEPIGSVGSTNDTYAALLKKGSNSNPYSPFASKTDWEVAKWAKLQGPSSTSLAELLKIEGVMSFCLNGWPTSN